MTVCLRIVVFVGDVERLWKRGEGVKGSSVTNTVKIVDYYHHKYRERTLCLNSFRRHRTSRQVDVERL